MRDNYPFSDAMVFCSRHTKESDIIEVDQCRDCFAAKPGQIVYSTCPQANLLGFQPCSWDGSPNSVLCVLDGASPKCIMPAKIAFAFDPFQKATPCWHPQSFIAFNIAYFGDPRPEWLSPLRQIALIEAAEELNERFQDVENDRFRAGFDGYVLKGQVR